MKWKGLMAILLGLLMIGMTTGVASARPITEKPIQPQHNIGLGSVIFSWIKGNAVISEGTTWVPGVGAYIKSYKS